MNINTVVDLFLFRYEAKSQFGPWGSLLGPLRVPLPRYPQASSGRGAAGKKLLCCLRERLVPLAAPSAHPLARRGAYRMRAEWPLRPFINKSASVAETACASSPRLRTGCGARKGFQGHTFRFRRRNRVCRGRRRCVRWPRPQISGERAGSVCAKVHLAL